MKTTYSNGFDDEIIIDPNKIIISKTDKKGIIQYANNYFIEVSGYSESELLNKPHNIIRHPDMPKVIFKIMWEKLHKGENLYAMVKNLTKDGRFYWVVTKFETFYNDKGEIISYSARRKAVPTNVRETTEVIYKTILEIEKIDEKLAEEAFYEILEEYKLTYDELFLEITGMSESETQKYFEGDNQDHDAINDNILIELDTQKIEKINFDKTDQLLDAIKIEEQINILEIKRGSLNNNNKKSGFLGNSSQLQKQLALLRKEITIKQL